MAIEQTWSITPETFTLSINATGGTFALYYDQGKVIDALPFNISAADLYLKLRGTGLYDQYTTVQRTKTEKGF